MHALIFTACYSRHMLVWLSFTQTLAAFIAGGEAAWPFFGGVFKVLVPEYVVRNIFRVLARPCYVAGRWGCGLAAGVRAGLCLLGSHSACPGERLLPPAPCAESKLPCWRSTSSSRRPSTGSGPRGSAADRAVRDLAGRLGYGAGAVRGGCRCWSPSGNSPACRAPGRGGSAARVDAFVARRAGESRDARRGIGQSSPRTSAGRSSSCSSSSLRGSRAPAARITPSRSPAVPGSSSTSHPSVACGPRRSPVTGTTSTGSRPTCSESASPGWMAVPALLSAFVAERSGRPGQDDGAGGLRGATRVPALRAP